MPQITLCNDYRAKRDSRVHPKSLHEPVLNLQARCMPTNDVCAPPTRLPLTMLSRYQTIFRYTQRLWRHYRATLT